MEMENGAWWGGWRDIVDTSLRIEGRRDSRRGTHLRKVERCGGGMFDIHSHGSVLGIEKRKEKRVVRSSARILETAG